MKSVIVGTAGHIDHGKTALVKALTGIDADRLEEEKRRGITIDIGFAHLELPAPGGEALRLGFVDVPGHERFVRNMLAGVGGIDMVLLVIAADESIKPQTREHFDICRLLSIRRGITVLTKSDMVDAETLDVVRLEVEEFLRGSFLDPSHAPIIPVSSLTSAGLGELKRALATIGAEVPSKDPARLTRLPIDRVFVMKGFGTVVTGTLISGAIAKEEELEIFPRGRRVRVRGIQVHGSASDKALAGQRTALNLAGVTSDDLARGMTLAAPGVFRTTRQLDVSLSLLASAKPLRDRARVHFHAYTAEAIAEVVLYSAKQIAAGSTAYAQLRLAEPMLLLPGDRFILRQFSPVITIGGGVVLNSAELGRRKKFSATETLDFLVKLEKGTDAEVLSARIARHAGAGLSISDAIAETGWRKPAVESALAQLNTSVMRFGDVMVTSEVLNHLKSDALTAVNAFHNANPLVSGIAKEELREKLGLGTAVFIGLLDLLVREKKLEATGEQVRIAGRGVVMKDDEAESKKQIEQAFAVAGLKVPLLKDVLAGLKVDKVRAQKIVTLLLRDRVLVKLADDLVFHQRALEDLRRRVVEHKTKSSRIDVAQFKDMTGVSRKYAIPLLEYLDRERVTKRVGDERLIL